MNKLWLLWVIITMYSPKLVATQKDSLGKYSPGNDSYFNIQTPHIYVDAAFVILLFLHSVYYSYKLINYSLENLSIKKETYHPHHHKMKHMEETGTHHDVKLKSDYFDTSAPQFTTSHTPMHFSIVSFENDIENLRQRKPSKARFCCCIRFVGWSFFQWRRTFIPRLVLRLYFALSCLLSMVLYIEFLVNILIEYIITCITHWDKGYIVGFVMIPMIVYIIYTLFHFAWHSIVAAWSHSADINGEIDSYDNEMIDSLECLERSKHNDDIDNFQYSWTKDLVGPQNSNKEINNLKELFSEFKDFDEMLDEMEKMMRVLTELNECRRDNISGDENDQEAVMHENQLHCDQRKYTANYSEMKMNQNQTGGGTVQLIPFNHEAAVDNKEEVDANNNDCQERKRNLNELSQETQIFFQNEEIDIDLNDAKSRKRETTKIRHKLRYYFQKAHEERLADYCLPTCWRFGFFFYTFFFAVAATLSINLQASLNGLFEGLVLRYCIIGGFIWNITYTICSFYLAVHSKFATWDIIHAKLPHIWFFLLVDAHDIEQYIGNSHGWTYCKMIVMIGSNLLFVLFFISGVSGWFIQEKWAGFLAFVGVIWFLYYLCNILMSAKPFSLICLWTDTIPLPGQNYTIHHDKMIDLAIHGKFKEPQAHKEEEDDSSSSNSSDDNSIHIRDDVFPSRTVTALQHIHEAHKCPQHKHHKWVTSISQKLQIDLEQYGAYQPKNDEFKERRKDNLMKRYKHFLDYTYEAEVAQKKRKCWNCCFLFPFLYKAKMFYTNYSHYWLHCYRPFDEYDIDTTAHIMQGFKCLQCCVDCRLCNINDDSNDDSKNVHLCGVICDWIAENLCNGCLCFLFIIFILGLYFMSNSLSGNNTNYDITEALYDNENATQYYAICMDEWGDTAKNFDLSVLDVLYIAECAYEMDDYDVQQMMDNYFGANEFRVITQNKTEPCHFHIKHNRYNLDIISIRGTTTGMDVLQDMSLYVEITLLEALKWVVPFLNGLSVSFIRQIIYYASKAEGVINSDVRDKYDEPIYDYAAAYLANNQTNNMYFVGHSLGGSISQVVAARLYQDNLYTNTHIQSFGICSPGSLYTSAKFGFGVESLEMTASSLLPRRDQVSNIDVHGGSIQWTNCHEKNVLYCHFIRTVICDMMQSCPADTALNLHVFECWCDPQTQEDSAGGKKPLINDCF